MQPDTHDPVLAFERWETVFKLCLRLEKEFYEHAHLPWAQKRAHKGATRLRVEGLVIGVVASLLAAALLALLAPTFRAATGAANSAMASERTAGSGLGYWPPDSDGSAADRTQGSDDSPP